MKTMLRNTLFVFFSILLTACAALQIDVDVYKGPLSEEDDVQLEQLISLAITSQRLLDDLQRQLLKDITITTVPSGGRTFHYVNVEPDESVNHRRTDRYSVHSRNPSRFNNTDHRKVTYGFVNQGICRSIENKNWELQKGVKDKESVVARLTMACNLEDILFLFQDDEENKVIAEFLQNTTEKYNLFIKLTDKFKQLEKRNEYDKAEHVNREIRGVVDRAIDDILEFMSKTDPQKLAAFDLNRDLVSVLSQLINPDQLLKAEQFLGQNYILNMKSAPLKTRDRADKVQEELNNSPEKILQLAKLKTDLKEACELESESALTRLCSTGLGRGVTLSGGTTTNGGQTDDSDLGSDEFIQTINKLKKVNANVSYVNSINADRYHIGIINLAKQAKYGPKDDKSRYQEWLYSMLLNYAGKLSVLADKQVLINGNLKSVKDASQQYVQVLQSVGSAIIVQINDIKARQAHRDEHQTMQKLEQVLARHHFFGNVNGYITKLVANLNTEKATINKRKAALDSASTSLLPKWRANFAKIKPTADLKSKIASVDAMLKVISHESLSTQNTQLPQYKSALTAAVLNTAKDQYCLANSDLSACDGLKDTQIIEKSTLNYANAFISQGWLEDRFLNPQPEDQTFAQRTENLQNLLNSSLANLKTSLAKQEKEQSEYSASHKDNINQLNALIGDAAKACIESQDCPALASSISRTDTKLTLYDNAIALVKNYQPLGDGTSSFMQDATALVSNDTEVNAVLAKSKRAIEKFFIPFDVKCEDDVVTNDNNGAKCTPDFAMKGVVRHLESLVISLQLTGTDSEVGNAKKALIQAHDLTARRQYLIPTSAYLRSSYPSSAIQDNNSATDWENMLQRGALHAIPLFGNNFANDSHVQQQVDKQYWQNINTVRITGGGNTNYVVVKDDIGNWYVKGYSSDPSRIYQSLASIALTNAASNANYFLNTNDGAVSLKSSGNVLDAMYGRFYEKYAQSTTAQFTQFKTWLADKKWETYLAKTCTKKGTSEDTNILELVGSENFATHIESYEQQSKQFSDNSIVNKDEAVKQQANLINQYLKHTAKFANFMLKESLARCEQPSGTSESKVSIGNDLYDLVHSETNKRQQVLKTFKQNILFIREGLPTDESPTPSLVGSGE